MGCRLCSPTAPGRCLHFECRGAPARVRAWRCEGRPPLPHHLVCVETFTLPYLRRLIYSSRTNGGGFDPCRAPTMSHEVYGASLVATIASHAQGTWIVRIVLRAWSRAPFDGGMAPGNVQLQARGREVRPNPQSHEHRCPQR